MKVKLQWNLLLKKENINTVFKIVQKEYDLSHKNSKYKNKIKRTIKTLTNISLTYFDILFSSLSISDFITSKELFLASPKLWFCTTLRPKSIIPFLLSIRFVYKSEISNG